jgi:hypothetical protein
MFVVVVVVVVALLLTTSVSRATDEASTAAFVERVIIVHSKQVHEQGVAMARGETVQFYFKASGKLKFNVHYHEGEDVTYVRPDASSKRLDSTLTATGKRDYWLMWTNESAEPVALYYAVRRQAKRL